MHLYIIATYHENKCDCINIIFLSISFFRFTKISFHTAFHCIAMSIVVLNLRKLMLSLPDFLKQHFLYFGFFEFSIIQTC